MTEFRKKPWIDPSMVMDCPAEDCDGFLMRTNLPSENGRYVCLICGLITWDTEEMQSSNLDMGQTVKVDSYGVVSLKSTWTPT